jgi:hypothetical protein
LKSVYQCRKNYERNAVELKEVKVDKDKVACVLSKVTSDEDEWRSGLI